mgnify:FL=1
MTGVQTCALPISSLRLVHAPSEGPEAELTLYYRTRDFAQTFAIFDGSEIRQVLDQFDVPGEGAGLLAKTRLDLRDFWLGSDQLEWGVDVRHQDGGTNERFRNLGDGFTRVRRAGGRQLFAGSWLEYTAAPAAALDLTAGVRADYWRVYDGSRTEASLKDGTTLLDQRFDDKEDVTVNGRLGLVYAATTALDFRAAGYTGFRVPTINEFFRPFRVGNDITEANAALSAERLYGMDVGADWQPLPTLGVELGYFRNWLEGAVGNVTLAEGPGVFPPAGFVPPGGTLSQRQNIDRIEADGMEVAARLAPAPTVKMTVRYQFVASRVTAFAAQPDLAGNRVAQSPRHTVTATARWRPLAKARLGVSLRHESARFDDDRNSRVLDPVTVVNLRGDYALTDHLRLFVAVENLFDVFIDTRLSGDGVPTRGQPRFISGGVQARF